MHKIIIAVVSAFSAFVFAGIPAASAQEPDEAYKYGVPPIDIDTYEIFDKRDLELPSSTQIDPVYLDETQYQYAACKLNDLKYSALDCGCYAMSFLKARLSMPDDHIQNVRKEADKQHCMVPEQLEAKLSTECHAKPSTRRLTEDQRNQYCSCYAGQLTPAMMALETGPNYGGRLRVEEQKAHKTCRVD